MHKIIIMYLLDGYIFDFNFFFFHLAHIDLLIFKLKLLMGYVQKLIIKFGCL